MKSQLFLKKRNDHKLSSKKIIALPLSCLVSELVGPITPEL